MPQVVYSKLFGKSAKKLPKHILQKLSQHVALLAKDPAHALLHQKQLKGELSSLYSFRIAREYRCVYQYVDIDTIELLVVKHRKDVYRKK